MGGLAASGHTTENSEEQGRRRSRPQAGYRARRPLPPRGVSLETDSKASAIGRSPQRTVWSAGVPEACCLPRAQSGAAGVLCPWLSPDGCFSVSHPPRHAQQQGETGLGGDPCSRCSIKREM